MKRRQGSATRETPLKVQRKPASADVTAGHSFRATSSLAGPSGGGADAGAGAALSALTCPSCRLGMLGEILLCGAGHSFCRRCYEQLKERKRPCILCGMPLPKQDIRNRSLEQIASQSQFSCRWASCGCPFRGGPADVRAHELQCRSHGMECVVKGCSQRHLSAPLLAKHLAKEHQFAEAGESFTYSLVAGSEAEFWGSGDFPERYIMTCKSGPVFITSAAQVKGEVLQFAVLSLGTAGMAAATLCQQGVGQVRVTTPTTSTEEGTAAEQIKSPGRFDSGFSFHRSLIARYAYVNPSGDYAIDIEVSVSPIQTNIARTSAAD